MQYDASIKPGVMLDNSEERSMLLLLRSERLFSERHGYKLKKELLVYAGKHDLRQLVD